MIKKIAAASVAVIIVLAVILTVIFSPKAIEIDFDSVVNEMKPVHNIGRMSDYELDSEMNSYFTEANMTSCRTHDINVTDIHRIFPDFSRDANDEAAYDFTECDKILAAIFDAGMEPFFRFGISWSDPEKSREHLQPPADLKNGQKSASTSFFTITRAGQTAIITIFSTGKSTTSPTVSLTPP